MKYDCPLIQDVMPLYKDGALSDSSRLIVEEHLKECPDCSALYLAEDTEKKENSQPITEPVTVLAKALSQKIRRRRIVVDTFVFVLFLASVLISVFLPPYLNRGKTEGVQITLGRSSQFTQEELQSAVDCVLEKFKDFEGCTLTKLWYDEGDFDYLSEAYLSNTQDLKRDNVISGNMIILFSEFKVISPPRVNGLEPGSTHTGWKWTLIRDSKTGAWRVDSWGYC